ncbi:MAG: transposase [Magnetovibrio sp.]|nr:transposase [Magnetovibrio sp.]
MRTGSPWRDLPSGFGHWNSTFIPFLRWAQRGVFDRYLRACPARSILNML